MQAQMMYRKTGVEQLTISMTVEHRFLVLKKGDWPRKNLLFAELSHEQCALARPRVGKYQAGKLFHIF